MSAAVTGSTQLSGSQTTTSTVVSPSSPSIFSGVGDLMRSLTVGVRNLITAAVVIGLAWAGYVVYRMFKRRNDARAEAAKSYPTSTVLK